ncbi:hypothetical protein BGX21_006755 [Mortierella sp. AD011]|nr:hypothetical protein BGX20_006771 [Mortierella sp. AD010]KAF9399123.1 hypothetical protein BGX21_006755 [Mortierella sp. AD011]
MSTPGPQSLLQGFRPVYNANTLTSSPLPSELVYIEPHFINQTGEYIVLWDEILVAFKNASHVRNGATLVPFLRDGSFQIQNPLRIRTFPGVILDVFFDSSRPNDLNFSPLSYPQVESLINSELSNPLPASSALLSVGGNINLGDDFYNNTQSEPSLQQQQIFEIRPPQQQQLGQEFQSSSSPQGCGSYAVPQALPEPESKTDPQYIAFSEYSLGLGYLEGNVVSQDHYKAMDMFRKAAKLGNPEAQCELALLYYKGNGTPKDSSKALKWFLRAAIQNNGRARAYFDYVYYQVYPRNLYGQNSPGVAYPDAKYDSSTVRHH